MNQSEIAGASSSSGQPERPPNYLLRAIVLSLLLVPLGLLIAVSRLFDVLNILLGPPRISEIPVGLSLLMAVLAGIAALMGISMPIAALVKSLQVNSRFDAGNYAGAESASQRTVYYSRQSIIFLIALSLIFLADILSYFTSRA